MKTPKLPDWSKVHQSYGIPCRYEPPTDGIHFAFPIGLHVDRHHKNMNSGLAKERLKAKNDWILLYGETKFPVVCFCAHVWSGSELKVNAAHTHCLRCVCPLPYGATLCFLCYDKLNEYRNRSEYIKDILYTDVQLAQAALKSDPRDTNNSAKKRIESANSAYDTFCKTGVCDQAVFWPDADSALPWNVPYKHH